MQFLPVDYKVCTGDLVYADSKVKGETLKTSWLIRLKEKSDYKVMGMNMIIFLSKVLH